MGRERTLLERLRDPERHVRPTIQENTQELADSILLHLQRMLNSRQGHALIQPEYGMPDGSEFMRSLPDAVDEIRHTIRSSIEKFEPRLRRVKVVYAPSEHDPFRMRFEVTAELVTEKEKASLWLETAIDSSGHVDVKG